MGLTSIRRGARLGGINILVIAVVHALVSSAAPQSHLDRWPNFFALAVMITFAGMPPALIAGGFVGHVAGRMHGVRPVARFTVLALISLVIVSVLGDLSDMSEMLFVANCSTLAFVVVLEANTRDPEDPALPPARAWARRRRM